MEQFADKTSLAVNHIEEVKKQITTQESTVDKIELEYNKAKDKLELLKKNK